MAPFTSFVNSSMCVSQQCIQASASILSNLSPNYQNIDPCTNFDELVCGGFRERNVIPDWQPALRQTELMNEVNYIILKNILESTPEASDSPARTDSENFKKLITGYNTCMNETAINKQGAQPLVSFLDSITDSFPITLDGYKNSEPFTPYDREAFSKTYLFLAQRSIYPFLAIDVTLDPFHPDTYIPSITPAENGVGGSIYENEEARSTYEKTVAQVFAKVLPTNALKSAAEDLARGVVGLEGKIALEAPSLSVEDQTQVRNLKNSTDLAHEFDFPSVFATISSSPVNRILWPSSEYSKFISQTLTNTTKPVLQAYFMWQAIQNYKDSIGGPELEPLKQFDNRNQGKNPGYLEARWRTCIADADKKMAWLLSQPFVEVRYTDAVEKTLSEMTTRIQHRLTNNINDIKWMTDSVKAIAKAKVEAITPKLGYPKQSPNLDDDASVEAYYTDLNVTDSFFDNAVSYSAWWASKRASLYGSKREPQAWPTDSTSALTANAFYYAQDNSIIIIASLLQQPLLDPALPAYVNYGALGTVIGHEFTHSLDSSGRNWDKDGAYADWWDDASDAGFSQRAECLVDQYSASNVTLAGTPTPIDGNQTLGENIADAGGVNTAYDAWQDKRREDPASDFDLPGLGAFFTHEQLFHVAAAQFFCEKLSDVAKASYLADTHSPSPVQLTNMMDNSRGFKQAFNCPVKEPTCEIY
ncbi:Metalloprotease [Hypoxylon crocopeplum]|nr:Metalloprotease [Hypoxylon crocopeplum]